MSRSLDLSSLAGATTLYIAFRHHDSTDQFIINFDDVSLAGVLGVNDNSFEGFSHYMANNQLTLSANSSMEKITMHNMLGQVVVSQKLSNNNEVIDLFQMPTGIYIVNVSIEGASKTFKIVKN